MATRITPAFAKKFIGTPALKGAEWMAENAYIAPGFHRLLTAGGLTVGLYGGRKFMDVLTARNSTNGEETQAKQTTELVRPLHGIMRYNAYSDKAADRWKFVVDRMAPVALGAVGAYYGGKLYFNGHLPNKEPLFPVGATTRAMMNVGKFSTEVTDSAMRLINADAIRKWAAATFIEGSSTGQHLFGALWPFNNGMIAVSFQEGAQRNISFPFARGLNKTLGNHGGSSRGQLSAMRETAKWMETNIVHGNPADIWATKEALLPRARDGLQKFPKQAKAVEDKLVDSYRKLIDDGYKHLAAFKQRTPDATDGEIRKHVSEFISGTFNPKRGVTLAAHDHLLQNVGVDLSNTNIGHGPFQFLGRLFGSHDSQHAVLEKHANYLNQEFGYSLDAKGWATKQLYVEPWKVAATYGGAATVVAAGLGTAAAVGSQLHSRSKSKHKPHITGQANVDYHTRHTDAEKPKTDMNIIDWVNDKPLAVAHWAARVVITPPSMHRFMNAAYLSAVLFGGVKLSNLLTGRILTKVNSTKFITTEAGELLSESILRKDKVWAPLKPLHGLLGYTPGSAEIADRWKQAAHFIMPVGLGMFGTWTGSHMYFSDRIRSLQKPDTLEDFADKISLEQSKFYAGATALTSIFNTGSGIHLLPVFNYSANLHNRYLLGSGQQVSTPGLGKWWSGNAGTTPWGVKRTLKQMTSYLTFNDSPRPKELRSLVHSLIGKLYPDLSDQELLDAKQVMLDRIHDVRDTYMVEGVIPPSKQAALGEAMGKLFAGEGFEALLRESGLDPAKADLAANGASGKIADFFGSRKAVDKLEADYRAKFAKRCATADYTKPADFLKTLIDKGPAKPEEPASPRSFAERTKAEASAYAAGI